MSYDLDGLRAAVALWEEADPGDDAFRAWERVERLFDHDAFPALLDDAALGRAVRAAAERDGPEREAMATGAATVYWHEDGEGLHVWKAVMTHAARALVAMGVK